VAGEEDSAAFSLERAWGYLADDEKKDLWRFTARSVQTLQAPKGVTRAANSEYDALCAAVLQLERKAPSRSAVNGLPRATRRLSGDELQKAVLKHKDRMFGAPYVDGFFTRTFCRWIQLTKTELLITVLDAFGCGHDEIGKLVGPMPDIDPSFAVDVTSELARTKSPHQLRVVFAGLMLSGTDWTAALTQALPSLVPLPEHPINNRLEGAAADEVMVAEEPRVPSSAPVPSPMISAVPEAEFLGPSPSPLGPTGMKQRLQDLHERLTSALMRIQQQEFPDPSETVPYWMEIESELQRLKTLYSVQSRSLVELEKKLQSGELIARIERLASLMNRVEHCERIPCRGLPDAGAQALEALANARAGNSELANRLVRPSEALVELIERADAIDDETATELDDLVRRAFGSAVATAALRGKLVFRTSEVERSSAKSLTSLNPLNESSPITGTEQTVVANAIAESAEASLSFAATPDQDQVEAVEEAVGDAGQSNDVPIPSELPVLATQSPESPNSDVSTGSDDDTSTTPAEQLTANAERVTNVRRHPVESFAQFAAASWIDQAGNVTEAPWRQPEFRLEQAHKARTSWTQSALGLALIQAQAADGYATPEMSTTDVAAAQRLISDPSELPALRDPDRLRRLRSGGTAELTAALSLTLESVAPTFPITLSSHEVSELVGAIGSDSAAVRAIIEFLLNGWAAAVDPLQLIRGELEQAAVDPQDIALRLSSAQSKLRHVVATLWSAAGGRVMHTHCRKAWSDFVRVHVAPLRDTLAPEKVAKKTEQWSVQEARRRIPELGKAFTRIMNEQGVQHQDRAAAIAGADQIVAAIEEVVAAKSQIEQLQRKRPGALFATVPHQALAKLMSELPSSAPDRACTYMLRAALTLTPQPNPLALSAGYLVAAPDVVRMLNTGVIARPDIADGILLGEISNVQGAAAALSSIRTLPTQITSSEQVLDGLRNAGIERQRWDVLVSLSASDVLQPHERTLLHRKALELTDQAYEQARRLERAWAACEELRASDASKYKRLVDEALEVCSATSVERPLTDAMLLLEWLRSAVGMAELSRDEIAQVRIQQAKEHSPEKGKQFEAYIVEKNYRSAMAMVDPGEPPPESPGESPRRTMWRKAAVTRFAQPRAALMKELKGVTQAQDALVSLWTHGEGDEDVTYRDTLRKALYNVISGEAGHTQEQIKRRFSVKLTELREHRERKTIIKCATIRDYFRTSGLNPTFLPQLAEFEQIVLTSSALSQGANALDAYGRAAIAEGPRTLTVFLEPGLPAGRRDEIASGLRKRKAAAVVLDDVDICRLCAIGSDAESHNFIPFLEVVLEQLDLEMVSPFSSLDGQHIRLETFIGRLASAEKIALNWDYTRLFSGRKLGKSAFLRYVTSTYDHYKLQNGKELRVVFISIAGGESEGWVVNCIIDEMNRRFAFYEDVDSSGRLEPADRFMRYVKRFVDGRKHENVLLILDEADAFVEDQLAKYDTTRETSLSFRMMKQMPAAADSTEMPRLRILFSGYRVTNTRGGVWANAGDVLILQPLAEHEAVEFLQGMLGRIGIDIGNHAPFAARRCGFQPAVLIRFGESLLKRLRRGPRAGARETYGVSHDDVIATMNDQVVLDEIRTVVNNNFQGNRAAAAIFGATLLSLKDLEPGMALDDGPKQVLKKLVEVDADIGWLGTTGAPPLAQIERQLQEFIDRELLTVSDAPRFGVREYRLRFPHFLPVLTQQTDVALEVGQHIQFLRNGISGYRVVESVLPDSSLDILRYWFRQSDTEYCSLAVAAGHWVHALQNDKVGVPDRLGVSLPGVARALKSPQIAERLSSGIRVFTDVGAEAWQMLCAEKPSRPLVLIGGIDLLRGAKRHVLEGGEPQADVATFSPMSAAAVTWWFEEVRALHFKSADAIAQIMATTDGIPLLVGAFDAVLPNAPATDVSVADLHAAVQRFQADHPALAAQLASGVPSVRLTDRELQLLRMVCRVAREGPDEFDLELDLPQYWAVCADPDDSIVGPMSDSGDRLAFQVLLGVGLLRPSSIAASTKTSALGRVHVKKDGALVSLLRALEPERAS
jgi:hypothetical protein